MKVSENCIGIPEGNNIVEFLDWVWFSVFGRQLFQLMGFSWYFKLFWIKFWKIMGKYK